MATKLLNISLLRVILTAVKNYVANYIQANTTKISKPMTETEFEALATKDDNTLYLIKENED